MSTKQVVPNVGRKPKVMTEQEKRIEALKKLRSDGKSTPAQDDEYSKLVADKNRSDLARLATNRVTKALKAIQQIRNLARLKPTDNQRKKVFDAMKEALESAHTAWEGNKESTGDGFQLEKE